MARLNKEAGRHVCYEVPMGGASPVGSVGFIEGYVELEKQLSAMDIQADYVFHATGTGGTMAGLAAGRNLVGSETGIISINVSAKDPEYPKRTAALANESLKLIGAGITVDAERDICTDLNYYLPGYEIPNEAASEAIKLLAVKEGFSQTRSIREKPLRACWITSGLKKFRPEVMWCSGIRAGPLRYLRRRRYLET